MDKNPCQAKEANGFHSKTRHLVMLEVAFSEGDIKPRLPVIKSNLDAHSILMQTY